MTGVELDIQLQQFTYPLPASQRQGIFALYQAATGKVKERRCANCASDAYWELKVLAKKTGENELLLDMILVKPNQPNPMLNKYRIKQRFRVHGSPKIQTNENTTDDEVELLLRINPKLRGHFERVDGADVMEALTVPEPKDPPVKKQRKKRVNG
jgi:hypothetical protein